MADFTLKQKSPYLWNLTTADGERYYHKSVYPTHISNVDGARFLYGELCYERTLESPDGDIIATSEITFTPYYNGSQTYDLTRNGGYWTLCYGGRTFTHNRVDVSDRLDPDMLAEYEGGLGTGGVIKESGVFVYLFKTYIINTNQGEWPVELSIDFLK